MQISNYPQNNNTFTGFRFNPASKERVYQILEGLNDARVTSKCRNIIASQKDNPIDIEIRNLDYCFGQKIDDGLEAYIEGELSHDNTGMDNFGFPHAREIFDEKFNIVKFFRTAAKKAEKAFNKQISQRIVNGENPDTLNRKAIESLDEII